MREIAPHVFIKTDFPGVTLGAIQWSRGTILIDAPFRADDIRAWRAAVCNPEKNCEGLLINLDEHYDRTLGSRLLEYVVVGHEKLIQMFKDRPTTFKPQTIETGAEWEFYNSQGNIRWAAPEITFSDQMEIHWDQNAMVLESHAGPSSAAIWVRLPSEKVVFVGDAVAPNSPPFLANADLPAWLETLQILLTPEYKHFSIISGRGGVVSQADVKSQIKNLEKIAKTIEKYFEKSVYPEEVKKTAQQILRNFNVPKDREQQYLLRLRYGLTQYLRKKLGATIETAE